MAPRHFTAGGVCLDNRSPATDWRKMDRRSGRLPVLGHRALTEVRQRGGAIPMGVRGARAGFTGSRDLNPNTIVEEF